MEGLLTLIVLIAIPYAIYRAIKALITHASKLREERERKAWEREKEWQEKNQRNDDHWNNPESR